MKILRQWLGAFVLASQMNGQTPNTTASCERPASLTLPNTTITLAQVVPTGALLASGHWNAQCRAGATAVKSPSAVSRPHSKPSSDSDIKIEVWLPM